MDAEQTIDDIEQLQEMFEAPDIRPLSASDISAANRRHDDLLAHSPWFRLWQNYGVCCRGKLGGFGFSATYILAGAAKSLKRTVGTVPCG
jgi:hypothetical protein